MSLSLPLEDRIAAFKLATRGLNDICQLVPIAS